jgi:hypothetical protein
MPPKDDEGIYGTQNSPRKRSRNLPLVPCTIRQILHAKQITSEDDDFLIDDQVVNQVSLVALIINFEQQPNHLNFQIDDATGVLDVRIWIEPPSNVGYQQNEWTSGRYVRVIGNIKAFGPRKTLIAVRLNIVEDPNEITYHHLECIHVHMKNTLSPPLVYPPVQQLPPPQQFGIHSRTVIQNQSGGMRMNHPANQLHQPHFTQQKLNLPQNSTAQSYLQHPPTHQGMKQRPSSGIFNKIQQSVMDTIKFYGHSNNGMNVKECAKKLKEKGNNFKEEDVFNTIKFLCDEGHLFTTIDGNHYAPTGA